MHQRLEDCSYIYSSTNASILFNMMPSISSIKAGFASFLKTSNAQNAQSSDQSPESVRQLTFSHNRDEKDSSSLIASC